MLVSTLRRLFIEELCIFYNLIPKINQKINLSDHSFSLEKHNQLLFQKTNHGWLSNFFRLY